jgi:4-hydroxy-3-methylbut-2-enyl diphosphate reductase IspH
MHRISAGFFICHAMLERQQAAVHQAEDADLVIVVGDERSNNSRRLVQVVQEIANWSTPRAERSFLSVNLACRAVVQRRFAR